MNQQPKPPRKNRLSSQLAGACLLMYTVTVAAGDPAEIGTVVWQQNYNPTTSTWNNGFFQSVDFNTDSSILASGFRGEADSASAIGIRYNSKTGAVIDTPPEWFLFEYSIYDYTQDQFHDQYIDSNGNIYFVGISYPATWNSPSARYNVPSIWKFSSTYTNPVAANPDRPLWRNYHIDTGTPEDNNGAFYGLAVDSADNIYGVGYYTDLVSTTSNRDWIIDKFDTAGTKAGGLFPLSHDVAGLDDYAYAVATDSMDNIIVVGSGVVDASIDHHDWIVRKYSSDGTLLWATQYDFAGGHDQAQYVVVDSEDNIIVSGYRRIAAPADDADWYIVKYAKDGDGNGGAEIIWDQAWDDGQSKIGLAYEMVLDHKDNFYVIGIQQKSSLVIPVYTNRYRPVLQYRDGKTGALLQLQNIVLDPTVNDKPEIEHDYIRDLALDGDDLVIGGYTQQDGSYTVVRGRTGRVLMLKIFPMFKDGFE